jgi:hypothetical protein
MATKKKTTETSTKPTKGQVRQVVRDKTHPDNPAMTLLSDLRLHGGIDYLCDFIRSCKLLKIDDADIVHELKKRYSLFLKDFTENDFRTWIRRDREIEKAYFSAYEAIGAKAMHKIYERLDDPDKADNEFILTVVDKFGAVKDEKEATTGTAAMLAAIYNNLK